MQFTKSECEKDVVSKQQTEDCFRDVFRRLEYSSSALMKDENAHIKQSAAKPYRPRSPHIRPNVARPMRS